MTRPVTWPAIVIGAGPAGAVTALALAHDGIETLLLDRAAFPREKACGCCVSHAALATLHDLGVADRLDTLHAAPVTTLDLRAGSRHAAVPLPPTRAISRGVFDTMLVDAAVEAGVTFRPATSARIDGDAARGDRVPVTTSDRIEHATVVIVADGIAGSELPDNRPCVRPGSRIGVAGLLAPDAADVPRGTIRMHCATGGYVGLVRLEDDRIDVGAALAPGFVRAAGGPAAAMTSVLASAGGAALGDVDTKWMGTGLLTRRRHRVAEPRVFVVGDAARYVEPITGEGIAWALHAATRLAPIAAAAARRGWRVADMHAWSRRVARDAGRRRDICRLVAAAARRPALMTAAVAVLDIMPWLAAPVVGRAPRGRKVAA